VRTERVEFFSDGVRLRGYLRWPDTPAAEPSPVLVQGPGWLGLATSSRYEAWHEGFTRAGYAVCVFDYRGSGESDGESGWINPELQLQDIANAVTYLETRPDIDPRRIGGFGMGGIGGGNAIIAAARDPRIRCVVAQTVVADGADWLHRMRCEHEWVDYLKRLEADRRRWVREGGGERVDPRQDLMVATPERSHAKGHLDSGLESGIYLRSAEFLLTYRPIDEVDRIAPRALLLTSIAHDAVTPADHALALYEKAGAPKKLIHQTNTTHYQSQVDNYHVLLEQFTDWYDRYLRSSPIEVRQQLPSADGGDGLRHVAVASMR
jgi:dipeptidyl aminopeptidase/acylaminoacyl peptidase